MSFFPLLLIGLFGFCMLYYVFIVIQSAVLFSQNLPSFRSFDTPFVSVIIPARNEEACIAACVHSVLAQNYPSDKWEVIVVNDHSDDQTLAILSRISAPNFRYTSIQTTGNSQKKKALAEGISLAKGEIILQTDADCLHSPQWISAMMGFFDAETAMVSGPVMLSYQAGGFFEKVQALEFLGLNVLGGGSIARQKPNMCNGANLAYRKAIYKEVNGFEGVESVASGDDELLMQKIAGLSKYSIRYAYAPHAIVHTPALAELRLFFTQRLRWVSKSRNYLNRGINLTQVLFFIAINGVLICAIGSLFYPPMGIAALGLFVAKMIADIILCHQGLSFFRQKKLWKYFLPFQILYQWKGRTVR
jgi:cellulose synthase/poly-beta-1,6-N-acetylglucosamine synthase-like glycosyltransferase